MQFLAEENEALGETSFWLQQIMSSLKEGSHTIEIIKRLWDEKSHETLARWLQTLKWEILKPSISLPLYYGDNDNNDCDASFAVSIYSISLLSCSTDIALMIDIFPTAECKKSVMFASSKPFLPFGPLDTRGNLRHCWYTPGKCQIRTYAGTRH